MAKAEPSINGIPPVFRTTITEVIDHCINKDPNKNYAIIVSGYTGKTTAYNICRKKYPNIFFMDDPLNYNVIKDAVEQHLKVVVIASEWNDGYIPMLKTNGFIIIDYYLWIR